MAHIPGSDELKVQHKEIHDRLTSLAHLGKALQAAEAELNAHINMVESGEVADNEDLTSQLQEKLESIDRDYQELMQQGLKRNLDRSSAMSPAKKANNRMKISHSQSAEDVSFASTLSEQFLVEARKMREEIHSKNKLLEDQALEKDQAQQELHELRLLVTDLRSTEERIKDENWNLELKVQELASKVSKSDAFVAKISSESGKLSTDKELHIHQIENLKVSEGELRQELDRVKSRLEQNTGSWQQQKDELEKENLVLHKTLNELKNELSNITTFISSEGQQQNEFAEDPFSTTEEDAFETPTNSPPLSPVQATPARSSALENETIRSTLQHSHRQIASLRNNILKERVEKNELKKRLNEIQGELERTKAFSGLVGSTSSVSSSNVMRTKRSKYFAKQNAAVKKAEAALGRSRGYDDSGTSSGGYVTAESDTGFETAQEDIAASTEDEVYQTGRDTLDGESSAGETETEQEANQTVSASEETTQVRSSGFFHEDPALESTASLSSNSSDEEQGSRRLFSRRSARFSKRASSSKTPSQIFEKTVTDEPKSLASEFISADDIKKHAELHGLIVVPKENYTELESKALNYVDPANSEQITAAATTHGLTVITKNEYDDLYSQASNLGNADYLTKTVLPSLGLVALTSQDLEKLKNPSQSTVAAQALGVGLKAIPLEEHEKLVKPSKEDIFAHAHGLGYKTLSFDDYHSLKNPSENEVHEHALSHGLKAIPLDHYERLQEPSAEDVHKHGERLGLKAVPLAEYEKLSNPSETDVHERCAAFGLKALPQKDYDNLVHESTRSLSREEIEIKAKDAGLVAVPSDEYLDLVRLRDKPSAEQIAALAQKIGYVPIEEQTYELWSNPTSEYLQSVGHRLGLTVVDTLKYEDLMRSIDKPTKEEAIDRAQKVGYVAIPNAEYQELTKPPTRSDIEAKIKSSNLPITVLGSEEYESLESLANRPTIDQLRKSAQDKNHILVSEEDHKALVDKANSPDKEHVKVTAAALGLLTIPHLEHEELVRKVNEPTRDELHGAATSKGLVLLDKSEHENLKDPSIEVISSLAKKHKHELLSEEDAHDLRNPSTSAIEQMASKNGLSLIPSDELVKLKNYSPSQDELEGEAAKLGLVIIPKERFEKLSKDANITIDQPFIASAAAGLGLATLTHEALNKLRQPPSFSAASDVVVKSGNSIIPTSDLKALKNPSSEAVISYAKAHGLVTIPESDFKELTKPYEPSTAEEVERFAAQFKLVTVPEALYAQQIAKPTREKIASEAAEQGLSVLPTDELQELQSRPKEFKPTVEELSVFAASNKMAIIPQERLKHLEAPPTKEQIMENAGNYGLQATPIEDLEDLKRRANSPSAAELETLATGLGRAVIPLQQFQDLHERAENPSKEKMTTHAGKMGLSLIPAEDLALLRRRAEAPTVDELREMSLQRFNHSVVPQRELEDLRRHKEQPTRDEVKLQTESLGLVAVDKDVYDELEKNAIEPDAETVSRFGKRLGYSMILSAELEDLKKKASQQPSKGELEIFAKKLNMVVIPRDQYSLLSERAELQSNNTGDSRRLSISNSDKLQSQNTGGSNLGVAASPASVKNMHLQSVATKREHFEDMIRRAGETDDKPVDKKVVESMRSLGYVPVAQEEYKRLLENQQVYNPTKVEIIRAAKNFGLTAIAIEEYKSLLKRYHSQTNSISSLDMLGGLDAAKSSNVSLASSVYMDASSSTNLGVSSRSPPMSPSSESTNLGGEVDMKSVPASYLATLRRIVESPTKEDATLIAKKAGIALGGAAIVSGSTSSAMGSPTKGASAPSTPTKNNENRLLAASPAQYNPTKDDVTAKAREFGLIPLTAEEHEALASYKPSPEEFKEHAKAIGLVSLSNDEYADLRKQAEKVSSVDDIKNNAQQLGLAVVPLQEIDNLHSRLAALDDQETQARQPLSEEQVNTHAKSLGLVTISEDALADLHNKASQLAALDNQKSQPQEPLSEDEVRAHAKSFGLAMLPEAELTDLHSKASRADETDNHQLQPKEPVSDEEFKEHAKLLGLATISEAALADLYSKASKFDELEEQKSQAKEPISEDEVRTHAKSLGLATLSIAALAELNNKANATPTPQVLQNHARTMGMVTLSQKEYNELANKKITGPELQEKARQAGLVTLTTSEYNKLKEVDPEKVELDAQRLGLVTVPITVYNQMINSPPSKPANVSEDDVRQSAEKLGLLVMNREQLEEKIQTRAHAMERKPLEPAGPISFSRREIEERARELGLVIVDADDYKRLSTATVTGPVHEFDPAIKEVKKSNVVVNNVNANAYGNAREMAATTAAFSSDEQSSIASLPPQAPLPSVSEIGLSSAESGTSNNRYNNAAYNESPATNTTRRSGRHASNGNNSLLNLSAATIASQASLTDRNMIPYITQVVIGEFLYKYSRSYGISGVSMMRHERYFWVHPYSLTLHWSKENPGSEMKHNPKTKSAAIISVKSVEDPNPLPPGIFHKTIVITTNDKVIKLTCPNRRRHNIWYNSLQYLIKRSTEELAFEEDEAIDDYVEDRHMEEERARTASVLSHRTSGSRITSIRRSIAPEFNYTTVKSMGNRAPSIQSRAPSVTSYRPPTLVPPPRSTK